MKTKEIVEDLRCCYKGKCDECTMGMKSGCIDDLLRASAEKLWKNEVEINNQRCEIEALKKYVDELKKENSERGAGWISLEERLPEEEGEIYFILFADENQPMVSYFGCGRFTHENVAYWMPIPEPPKKVKTYKDVYRERIKEVFPDFTNKDPKPSYCRPAMFGEDFNREYICGKMKDCEECWNQPCPEEEGGEE